MDLADAIDRARQLQDEDRPDEAIALLLAAAEEHEDENLRFEIASFYMIRGSRRHETPAMADFDEADKWADLTETRIGRASVLCRRGEHGRAEELLQEGLEHEFPWAFVVLAQVRLAQSRVGDAKQAVGKALELDPKYGGAYAALADVLKAEGRADLAEQALEEGARKCPLDDRLLTALAGSYRVREDFERARRALEQAVLQNRENVWAWRDLAWVAAKGGDETRMRESLDRAVELDREGTLAWIANAQLTLPELDVFGLK